MFLATTAIDSFWDTNKKIIFLGPWCLISKNKHIWKSLDYEIMPSPWQDRDAYYKAGKYTYKIYHYLLGVLTDNLNFIHETNHSKRFWQIIIGPWLLHYTETFYDKYCCIKKALEEYRTIETIMLDNSSFMTPKDTADFFDLYVNDLYNLQIYSQLLEQFGIEGYAKSEPHQVATAGKFITSKGIVKKCLLRLIRYIAGKRNTVLLDINLNYAFIFRYMVKSGFSAFPVLFDDYCDSLHYSVCMDIKRQRLVNVPAEDEFSQVLINSLSANFPTLYLEGFGDFLEKSLSCFKNAPKVLISVNGWYSDERLKFLAAHWMEQGTVLCGCQHGGLYGTAKWMPPENHEIEITDRYYTWGWKRKDNNSIKALPNPKISNLMYRKTKYYDGSYFLFVGMNHPRYLYRFFSCPVGEMFNKYLEWRNVFIRNLTNVNSDRLLMRLYQTDYCRDERGQITREFPNTHFDNHHIKFLDQLERSSIAIIDHPVTTMLESLALNHPTVLFWNPMYWELRDEAKPFFEKLYDANIWHKDPKSAAEILNDISGNPIKWWNNPKTQSARKMFVKQFAYGDKKWPGIWWSEIQGLLKLSA